MHLGPKQPHLPAVQHNWHNNEEISKHNQGSPNACVHAQEIKLLHPPIGTMPCSHNQQLNLSRCKDHKPSACDEPNPSISTLRKPTDTHTADRQPTQPLESAESDHLRNQPALPKSRQWCPQNHAHNTQA